MNKPITVLREEFVENLQKLIEGAGLMPFMVHDILVNIDAQVLQMAKKQYTDDLARYQQSLEEGEIEYKDLT